MSRLLQTLGDNLAVVRQRMADACRVTDRPVDSVQLIAVTKYAEPDWIEGLISLGLTQFGENRPQQLVERQARWPQVQWHLIGHLQRNKVKSVLGQAALIHSVDSVRLAERLSEESVSWVRLPAGHPSPQTTGAKLNQLPILCEVNVSGEASKDGFSLSDLRASWDQLIELPGLELRGLMTMAPLSDDPEAARPIFAGLRQLRDELRARSPATMSLSNLSMGMSGDFEIAIQEGATLIRVGSRLFEGLTEGPV
jgi:PLP dependent protein